MGQYHEIWAFDTAGAEPETIDHYKFGAGAKLAEQAYCSPLEGDSNVTADVLISSPYAAAIGLMVMTRWANRRLIVIGDYAEPSMCPHFDEEFPLDEYYGATPDSDVGLVECVDATEEAKNLLAEAIGYTFSGDGWCDIQRPDDFKDRIERIRGHEGPRYVIASGKGEFIRPEPLRSQATALAMPFIGGAWGAVIGLLACSDGQGGGDLQFEIPGRWAYTNVGIVPEDKVDGMADITDWVLRQERFARWVVGDE